MIGSTVGTLWVKAGHDVRFASRHPQELQPLVKKLDAHASAGTIDDAARFGEVVMLSVPLAAMPQLASDIAPILTAKIVLDTGNAYERRDGDAARHASEDPRGSAGWAAAMFPGARWVKAFNTVYFKTPETEAHRKGDRVAIPLASDDKPALDVAAKLVTDAGFEPVVVGELASGKSFEPGTRVYNTGMTAVEVRRALHSQHR